MFRAAGLIAVALLVWPLLSGCHKCERETYGNHAGGCCDSKADCYSGIACVNGTCCVDGQDYGRCCYQDADCCPGLICLPASTHCGRQCRYPVPDGGWP